MANQKHTKINFPQARDENVVVESVGDETVIYDLDTHVAHALKPLAAAVYAYADGKNTAAEIAELASYRLATAVSEADVVEAIAQLEAISMITAPVLNVRTGLSRRQALKSFAAAGAGSVLVMSVATSAASACYTCTASQYPNANASCTKNTVGNAGVGDCKICQADSQCGSDASCWCAPCDGAKSDCCQPVCFAGTTPPAGYNYLPLGGKPGTAATIVCPTGYYQYQNGYAVACCNAWSPYCKTQKDGVCW